MYESNITFEQLEKCADIQPSVMLYLRHKTHCYNCKNEKEINLYFRMWKHSFPEIFARCDECLDKILKGDEGNSVITKLSNKDVIVYLSFINHYTII